MKKIYLVALAIIAFSTVQAQTANCVVFTEAGEKFSLFLNGERQNASPMSNVKVSGLTSDFYQARVDFEDAKLADFSENNFAVQKGVEATYIIKKNKKGEYVMRFHSQAQVGTSSNTAAATPQASDDVKRIATVDDGDETSGTHMSTEMRGEPIGTDEGTTVVQTTTTTTSAKPTKTNGESVNIGMNVDGINMGMNVNVTGMETEMEPEENSSTTVTTTTKTTSTSSSTVNNAPRPKEDVVVVESKGTCAKQMTDASFTTAKANVESKGFDETKLTVAKQVTKANCLTAAQIKSMMDTFGFEETKLAYAKYAYDFCFNQGDYYLVNEAFSFESTIEELNTYIESK